MKKIKWLLFVCVIMNRFISGAQTPVDSIRFFTEEGIIEMTLTTDIRKLRAKESIEAYQPADISVRFPGNTIISEPIRLYARGKSRRETCNLPPIMLDFHNPSSPLLYPLSRLKLVVGCGTSEQDEQLVLKEYLLYKMYNVLEERSFRARLAKVTYNDSRGKMKTYSQYAFLLEDVDDMAKKLTAMGFERFGMVEAKGQFAIRGGIIDIFSYTDDEGYLQLIKLNSALEVVKQKELASEAFGERFFHTSMFLDNDGNFVIGNNFIDEFSFEYFIKLYKVDSDLNIIFEEEIIGEEHELLGLSISPTKDNSILLSGYGELYDNSNYTDAFVYKLDENGKLSSIGDQTELSATSMVYPNPVTDLCKINFPAEGLYDLKLVNIFGQEIYYRLSDITANTATIDLSNVRNGIYFLQISQANRHMESIKVVKI